VLLEVSHWHAPLYFDALEAAGGTVVAVSDRNLERAGQIGARFGARPYEDWRVLLEKERADFAVAFGRHREMLSIGEALVERATPFVLEKPCGLTAAEVRRLRDRVHARGLFAAVPLVQSLGPFGPMLGEARRAGGPHHAWFRFLAGPPTRYPAAGCGWMLDPAESGGGCFMNLAGHFLDLTLRVLPRIVRVTARMSAAVHGEAVEDYALAVLEAADGGTATIETGYLFPAGTGRPREVYYSLFGREGARVFWGDRAAHAEPGRPWIEESVDLDSDPLYAAFVHATLGALREKRPAPVGLDEMAAVMELIEAAYRAARTGQPVSVDVEGYGGGHA
jgi:predicted dehydrogenase